jgi:hypothetical protein
MKISSKSQTTERLVRTITLTREDLSLLDDIERFVSSGGYRMKTDSKLIRAAIQIAQKSLNKKPYDLADIAEKVMSEDGRTQSKLLLKGKDTSAK